MAKWLFTARGPLTVAWLVQPPGLVIDPVLLSAARAVVSFALVLVYVIARRPERLAIRTRDLPFLAVFGVFGLAMVHYAYFKTISLTGVATAILLEYLAPVIVLAFSVAFLRERLTWSLPAAVALSIAGCALMVGAVGGAGLQVSGEGIAWGLASAVFFAGYALMGRYAARRFSPWTLLVYGLGAASIFWMVVLRGPGPVVAVLSDWRGLAAVSVLSVISTVVPFAAFLKALHMIEATKASITSTAEPVLAGLAAWILFAEQLSVTQLLGGALVVCAVALSQVGTGISPEVPLAEGAALGEDAASA